MTVPFAIGDELLAEELNDLKMTFTFQKFTASGTWVKPDGCSRVLVDVIGGGGSGGGNPATGAGQGAQGGGGGGGGYARKLFLASDLATSETVTIGAGGTAAGSNSAGNTGGTSSFATGKAWEVTAVGGSGGAVGIALATTAGAGGAGGTASGGDLNIAGQNGGPALVFAAANSFTNIGGPSHFSPAAYPIIGVTTGTVGKLYGGGSSGSIQGASGAAQGGVAGASGIVIIYNCF